MNRKFSFSPAICEIQIMKNLTVDKSEHCKIYQNSFTKTKLFAQLFANVNLFENLQEIGVIFQIVDEKYCQNVNPRTLYSDFGNVFAKSLQGTNLNSNGFHSVLRETVLNCKELPAITQTSDFNSVNDDFMDCNAYCSETIDRVVAKCDADFPEPRKTFKDAIVQTAFSVTDSQCQCELSFNDSKCNTNENPKQDKKGVNCFRSLILNEKADYPDDIAVELSSSQGEIDFQTDCSRKPKSHLKTISRIRIGLSKRFKPRPLHNKF